MSVPWININQNLIDGVAAVNAVPNVKFSELLETIINTKKTTESKPKLEELLLDLDGNDRQLIIESCLYILNHSLKIILKPTNLLEQLLTDLKFDRDKAEIFVKIWSDLLKTQCGHFENLLYLNDISWDLNLQSSTIFGDKEIIPNITLKFDLANFNNSGNNQIIFEIPENDTFKLYNALENIQSQLDFIQNNKTKY